MTSNTLDKKISLINSTYNAYLNKMSDDPSLFRGTLDLAIKKYLSSNFSLSTLDILNILHCRAPFFNKYISPYILHLFIPPSLWKSQELLEYYKIDKNRIPSSTKSLYHYNLGILTKFINDSAVIERQTKLVVAEDIGIYDYRSTKGINKLISWKNTFKHMKRSKIKWSKVSDKHIILRGAADYDKNEIPLGSPVSDIISNPSCSFNSRETVYRYMFQTGAIRIKLFGKKTYWTHDNDHYNEDILRRDIILVPTSRDKKIKSILEDTLEIRDIKL